MLHGLESLTLTQGPLHVLLLSGAVAGLCQLLLVRRDRLWWTVWVPIAVVAATLPAVAFRQWVIDAKPWPDGLPFGVAAWGAAGLLGPALLVVGWAGRRWRIRMLGCVTAVLAVLGSADAIDTVYGAYPTVATALQLPPANTVAAAAALHRDVPPTVAPAATAGPLWQRLDTAAGHAEPRRGHAGAHPGDTFRVLGAGRLGLPPARLPHAAPAVAAGADDGQRRAGRPPRLAGRRTARPADGPVGGRAAGLAPVVVMPDGLGR